MQNFIGDVVKGFNTLDSQTSVYPTPYLPAFSLPVSSVMQFSSTISTQFPSFVFVSRFIIGEEKKEKNHMISLKKTGGINQDSIAEVLQVDKEELHGLGEKWLSTSIIAFDTVSSSVFVSRGSKACICDTRKESVRAVDLQES
jgi:hypothetical protein